MAGLTAPYLLRTPKGYPESWKRIFEILVSPIKLVRDLRMAASRNQLRDKASGKESKPWLSPEQLQGFHERALVIRQDVHHILDLIDGIADETWHAGSEIQEETSMTTFYLAEELKRGRYPDHVLPSVQESMLESSRLLHEIPLLEKLRKAIAVEKSIRFAPAIWRKVCEGLSLIRNELTGKNRQARGRKLESDPNDDKRIYDGWKQSGHRKIADYAKHVLNRPEREIKLAVGRHKKRLRGQGNK